MRWGSAARVCGVTVMARKPGPRTCVTHTHTHTPPPPPPPPPPPDPRLRRQASGERAADLAGAAALRKPERDARGVAARTPAGPQSRIGGREPLRGDRARDRVPQVARYHRPRLAPASTAGGAPVSSRTTRIISPGSNGLVR